MVAVNKESGCLTERSWAASSSEVRQGKILDPAVLVGKRVALTYTTGWAAKGGTGGTGATGGTGVKRMSAASQKTDRPLSESRAASSSRVSTPLSGAGSSARASLSGAGGGVAVAHDDRPLRYGKEKMLRDWRSCELRSLRDGHHRVRDRLRCHVRRHRADTDR